MPIGMTTRKKAKFFTKLKALSLDRMELANAYSNAYSLATIIIAYDYTVNLLRFF